MRRTCALAIFLLWSPTAFAETLAISYAHQSSSEDEVSIRQLTGLPDDEATSGADDETIHGCLLTLERGISVKTTSAVDESTNNCINHRYRRWEVDRQDAAALSALRRPRSGGEGYYVLSVGASCPGGYETPERTDYNDLPVMPPYIKLDPLVAEFRLTLADLYSRAEALSEERKRIPLGEANSRSIDYAPSQERDDRHRYILKRAVPDASVDLETFHMERGRVLHHATVHFHHRMDDGYQRIAVADYWTNSPGLGRATVLFKRERMERWIRVRARHDNPGSYDLPRTVFGPFVAPRGDPTRYYFLKRSYGYESMSLDLERFELWGSEQDEPETVQRWSTGC